MGAIVHTVPIIAVLLYAMSRREYVLDVTISVVLMILLLIADVYLNFFDYTILYDVDNREWIVKRFNKELRFKDVNRFTIRPYYFLSKTLFFYSIELDNATFRFRYPYLKASVAQSFLLEDFAKKVEDEILQTVQNAINSQKKPVPIE